MRSYESDHLVLIWPDVAIVYTYTHIYIYIYIYTTSWRNLQDMIAQVDASSAHAVFSINSCLADAVHASAACSVACVDSISQGKFASMILWQIGEANVVHPGTSIREIFAGLGPPSSSLSSLSSLSSFSSLFSCQKLTRWRGDVQERRCAVSETLGRKEGERRFLV